MVTMLSSTIPRQGRLISSVSTLRHRHLSMMSLILTMIRQQHEDSIQRSKQAHLRLGPLTELVDPRASCERDAVLLSGRGTMSKIY